MPLLTDAQVKKMCSDKSALKEWKSIGNALGAHPEFTPSQIIELLSDAIIVLKDKDLDFTNFNILNILNEQILAVGTGLLPEDKGVDEIKRLTPESVDSFKLAQVRKPYLNAALPEYLEMEKGTFEVCLPITFSIVPFGFLGYMGTGLGFATGGATSCLTIFGWVFDSLSICSCGVGCRNYCNQRALEQKLLNETTPIRESMNQLDESKVLTQLPPIELSQEKSAQKSAAERAGDDCPVCREKTDPKNDRTVYTKIYGEEKKATYQGPMHIDCAKKWEKHCKDKGLPVTCPSSRTVPLTTTTPRQRMRFFRIPPTGGELAAPPAAAKADVIVVIPNEKVTPPHYHDHLAPAALAAAALVRIHIDSPISTARKKVDSLQQPLLEAEQQEGKSSAATPR